MATQTIAGLISPLKLKLLHVRSVEEWNEEDAQKNNEKPSVREVSQPGLKAENLFEGSIVWAGGSTVLSWKTLSLAATIWHPDTISLEL